MLCSHCRVELYVILCSDDVYTQETPGSVVYPVIPYEEVSKLAGEYLSTNVTNINEFYLLTYQRI